MVVAVDIDGVLRDITTTIEKMVSWKEGNQYFVTKYNDSKITDALREDQRRIFLKSPIYPGAKEFMDWLYDNARVKVISYQPNVGGILFTNLWLKNHGIKYHDLIYVSKPQEKLDHEWDIIIEDSPYTAREAVDKGRKVCLINRRYNQDSDIDIKFEDYNILKEYISALSR